ncbi:MAG: hypothetical protein ACLTDR_15110 [Adlercreutzia equolifaciens]
MKASKGVILCTGGFEFNEELQAKYLKCYPMRGFYGWKYNTGDGITMAQKVGADLWHMQQVCGGDDAWFDDPEIVPGGVSVQSPTPNYIKVSRLGERWGNEEIFSPHGGWKPYANFDEEICDFDRIPSWYIFDQTSFDGGSWGGMVGGAATENGGMGIGYMTARSSIPNSVAGPDVWSADNKWELERGWILAGATLDELAANVAASKWDDKMDAEKLRSLRFARWGRAVPTGALTRTSGPPAAGKGRDRVRSMPFRLRFRASAKYHRRCSPQRERQHRRSERQPDSAPVLRRLVRQHEWPHLRHHRRQWLRELVRWPYRRPQCRRPRTLGCRDRGLDPAWRR